MKRLTEVGAEKVRKALEALQIPGVVRDQIEWDVVPGIGPGMFSIVPIICFPVTQAGEDFVLHMGAPGLDPHETQEAFNDAIRRLVAGVQEEAAARKLAMDSSMNGHSGMSPGGLAIP